MGLFFVVLLSLATTVAVGKRDEVRQNCFSPLLCAHLSLQVQKAYDKLM